jgi:hypothetical protein
MALLSTRFEERDSPSARRGLGCAGRTKRTVRCSVLSIPRTRIPARHILRKIRLKWLSLSLVSRSSIVSMSAFWRRRRRWAGACWLWWSSVSPSLMTTTGVISARHQVIKSIDQFVGFFAPADGLTHPVGDPPIGAARPQAEADASEPRFPGCPLPKATLLRSSTPGKAERAAMWVGASREVAQTQLFGAARRIWRALSNSRVDHGRTSPVGLSSSIAPDPHAGSGGDRSRRPSIRRRMSANSARGTATSASWNTT